MRDKQCFRFFNVFLQSFTLSCMQFFNQSLIFSVLSLSKTSLSVTTHRSHLAMLSRRPDRRERFRISISYHSEFFLYSSLSRTQYPHCSLSLSERINWHRLYTLRWAPLISFRFSFHIHSCICTFANLPIPASFTSSFGQWVPEKCRNYTQNERSARIHFFGKSISRLGFEKFLIAWIVWQFDLNDSECS